MRRGRYLRNRQESVAIRRINQFAQDGVDIIYRREQAIVTRRIYSAQSTTFDKGVNVQEEQYAVNIQRRLSSEEDSGNDIVPGDQVILGITDTTTDQDIKTENRRVLIVKSTSLGVNVTRLNCIEL